MSKKVNWYVSCSPRSPEKIQPELKVLTNFENSMWRGKAGHEAQELFARALAELPEFLGSTHEKEASFSARDRVAPMKTYGFVYTAKDGTIKVTEAGKMLAEERRPKDVFLKQLAKWQYPSFQHKGSGYPEPDWKLNPFIFVLRLLKKVESLSKMDIAMFCLTVTNNNQLDEVASEIQNFRNQLKTISGENARLQFIDDYFYNKFSKVYSSATTIREGKSKDKVRVKMQNAVDVADATTRYFRYTGLFVARGNKLVLNPEKMDLINELISLATINPNYKDVEVFHEYYGNPTLPKLSFETQEALYHKARKYFEQNNQIAQVISSVFPNVEAEIMQQKELFSNITLNSTIEELKDVIYYLHELQIELRVKEKQIEYQNPENIDYITGLLNVYFEKNNVVTNHMKDKFLANKNTVFEWLVWNGFIILGNAIEYKNNFIIDEELSPVTHAAGNQSDMEIIYEDFIVLGEVTTSRGATQFNMEAEPITRHYRNKQSELKEKGINKDLYCLFIAPTLNDNTFNHFADYNETLSTKILPLSLEQYLSLLNFQRNLKLTGVSLKSCDLQNLYENLLDSLQSNSLEGVKVMKEGIQEALDEWQSKFNKIN